MYLTIRHYEEIDAARIEEVKEKVDATLLPALQELPGFGGYYLLDCGEGVLTSVGIFDEAAQAHESTRVAARWIRDQDLLAALPNPPRVTAGTAVAVAQTVPA